MKKMILAAALCLSGSVFAQVCEVDMVDNRTNRILSSFRAYDGGDGCKEGMKQCRFEIRQRGLLNQADCIRRNSYPNPIPNPMPNPNPNPYPYPNPTPNPVPGSYDAQRPLNRNDSAIMNNRYVDVIGVAFNGTYSVQTTDAWRTVSNGVRREQLSVTRGCNLNLCVNDSVIDTKNNRYMKVVGLMFNNQFVIQTTDPWKTISSNHNRANLAVTKGCTYYNRVCVGNTVLDRNNRYQTVVAIQENDRVVLQTTDAWKTISSNHDTSYLVIVR